MRKQKRIWAYLLSAAMVVTSFTMSSATGKAEGTTEKGKIVSVTDRTSTKKAASVTENGKVASVTKKVSTKKTAGTDSFQDLNRQQITEAMGVGYNLGNSLEANSGGTPNETAWGNPVLTKEFVLAAKAAGFQSIRIPVSYLSKIDDNNGYKIDSAWLDHVQEVVDYCVQNDMYAIVNMHGDGYTTVSGGWLLCASSDQTKIKAKYKACWEQIADRFKNYDEHIIFESMNEEFDGTYGTPNKTAYNNINDYNQIFVDTVRQTGGNNDRRWLLIPGWNTNINYTADNYGFVLPTDQYLSSDIASGEKRIMISVHYYDPWDFCGTESADKTQWGSEATNQSKVPTWGDESYMASQFKKMNDKFVSQGYGVIIGEFGAINKANYDSRNKACRADYYQKVCYYAKQYELVPVAWDNGFDGDYGFCLINRYSCQVTHQDIIDAMMEIYRASSTATGIALDQQKITIHVGDEGTQLNATLTPSDSKEMDIR
jgi:endoglucanase